MKTLNGMVSFVVGLVGFALPAQSTSFELVETILIPGLRPVGLTTDGVHLLVLENDDDYAKPDKITTLTSDGNLVASVSLQSNDLDPTRTGGITLNGSKALVVMAGSSYRDHFLAEVDIASGVVSSPLSPEVSQSGDVFGALTMKDGIVYVGFEGGYDYVHNRSLVRVARYDSASGYTHLGTSWLEVFAPYWVTGLDWLGDSLYMSVQKAWGSPEVDRIYRLNSDLEIQEEILVPDSGLAYPGDFTFLDGDLFVANWDTEQIKRYRFADPSNVPDTGNTAALMFCAVAVLTGWGCRSNRPSNIL